MILAVLDDPDSTGKVVAVAERLGLPTVLGKGTESLLEMARGQGLAVIVVDISSSGMVPLVSLRQNHPDMPALIVAVGRGADKASNIAALRSGADCYLPMPLDVDLLEAHLQALLRRFEAWMRFREAALPFGGGRFQSEPEPIAVRDLVVDFGAHAVRLRGRPVPVTPAEYRLLASLASRLGKVVSAADLLNQMSGYECAEQEAQEIVKVHVSRLRSKLDLDPEEPSYLLNVRGFGYMLERRSKL